MTQLPTVHILLATYNGGLYLAEQLKSLARQTHCAWTLTVSDDGSTDDSLNILERFASQVAQPVTVLQGPRQGSSTANFCYLVAQAQADNVQDLYAFCDQDDVWHDDKLQRAVLWHMQHSSQPARLYCGRTEFVDDKLRPIGLSPTIKHHPSFGNALVQNIANGNTMVFSHAILVAQQKIHPSHCVWHDWTTYIVATALGGVVLFENEPCLYYRQHGGNVVGSNVGFKSQISRLLPLFRGRFKQWSDMNTCAIQDVHSLLPRHSCETFSEFQLMRTAPSCLQRITIFYKSDIRRQFFLSNVMLAFALTVKLV